MQLWASFLWQNGLRKRCRLALTTLYLLPQHLQKMKSPTVGVFFFNSWLTGVVFLTTPLTASCRVEMQKMKLVRPPADVARYTMIFHKRDRGNEENRERWVRDGFLPCIVMVCAWARHLGDKFFAPGQTGFLWYPEALRDTPVTTLFTAGSCFLYMGSS